MRDARDVSLSTSAFVDTETEIAARRTTSNRDRAPLVRVGQGASDLTIFFEDDATARRFAEAILAVVNPPAEEEAPAEPPEAAHA